MSVQTRWQLGVVGMCLWCVATFGMAQEHTAYIMEYNTSVSTFGKTSIKPSTQKPTSVPTFEKVIIGAVENVRLVPPNVVLKARIDTGAKTTSVDARNITPFERDGVLWVKFDCVSQKKVSTIKKKVLGTVEIKRHNKPPQTRYVVKMRITLGDVSRVIEVNLNNRDAYTYPVLIGRNFLHDTFIVDITKRYRFKPKKYQEKK